jgi:hypothetical protein
LKRLRAAYKKNHAARRRYSRGLVAKSPSQIFFGYASNPSYRPYANSAVTGPSRTLDLAARADFSLRDARVREIKTVVAC